MLINFKSIENPVWTLNSGENVENYLLGLPYITSLPDILFSFVLEKYIVCDVCRLRSHSFESSSVLYISPTDTSSMQNLILQGLQIEIAKVLFSM